MIKLYCESKPHEFEAVLLDKILFLTVQMLSVKSTVSIPWGRSLGYQFTLGMSSNNHSVIILIICHRDRSDALAIAEVCCCSNFTFRREEPLWQCSVSYSYSSIARDFLRREDVVQWWHLPSGGRRTHGLRKRQRNLKVVWIWTMDGSDPIVKISFKVLLLYSNE